MFVLGLLASMSAAQAGDAVLSAQLAFWPTASRHLVAPGVALTVRHRPSWWGVDGELSFATALERSATVRFNHLLVRGAVLWSVDAGAEALAFQVALGPSLLVHRARITGDDASYSTGEWLPGVRGRVGLGGSMKRLAWRISVGATSADWPRTHFDVAAGLGVGW